MTSLEQYNKELYHYGVLGMKWGIRRYQNKDGTLTSAGRKRLDTEAGWYLNPKYKDKKSVNRKAVSKEYIDAYSELMRKHGIDISTMDGTEASWKLEKKSGKKNLDGKLWNSFLDKYATATLKDLGYKDSTNAKEYVKELFRNDLLNLDE